MTTNLTFKLTAAAALTFCSLALQAEETVQTSEVTVTAGRLGRCGKHHHEEGI